MQVVSVTAVREEVRQVAAQVVVRLGVVASEVEPVEVVV